MTMMIINVLVWERGSPKFHDHSLAASEMNHSWTFWNQFILRDTVEFILEIDPELDMFMVSPQWGPQTSEKKQESKVSIEQWNGKIGGVGVKWGTVRECYWMHFDGSAEPCFRIKGCAFFSFFHFIQDIAQEKATPQGKPFPRYISLILSQTFRHDQ